MDFQAALEHKIRYKYENAIRGRIAKELKECAMVVACLDEEMQKLNKEVSNENEEKEGEDDLEQKIHELLNLFKKLE